MPVTVVVHGERRPPTRAAQPPSDSRGKPGEPGGTAGRALTFDGPRIVLGRGDGADVRLPDASVSHRHATLRLRGTEYILVDEGSANGTRIGRIRLSPQSPRVVRSGEIARIGRVWVEIVVGPTPPTKQAHHVAKEIALGLVTEALLAEGEAPSAVYPVLEVEEGPDAGKSFVLDVPSGSLGCAADIAVSLTDPDVSRRHADVAVRGDVLVVRDLGSKGGTRLGEREIGATDVVWKAEERLTLGATVLRYTYPAAVALAEIERAPDEKLTARDLDDDEEEVVAAPDEAVGTDVALDAMAPEDVGGDDDLDFQEVRRPVLRRDKVRWGFTDFAVMLVALGIVGLSALGYMVLLK